MLQDAGQIGPRPIDGYRARSLSAPVSIFDLGFGSSRRELLSADGAAEIVVEELSIRWRETYAFWL